jgi:hypothetical protein
VQPKNVTIDEEMHVNLTVKVAENSSPYMMHQEKEKTNILHTPFKNAYVFGLRLSLGES